MDGRKNFRLAEFQKKTQQRVQENARVGKSYVINNFHHAPNKQNFKNQNMFLFWL